MWVVCLVSISMAISVGTGTVEYRTIQPIRRFPSPDLLCQICHTLEDARGLINVIADRLQLRRTAQNKKSVDACFNRPANVRFHGVANHDDGLGFGKREFG